jgi:sugar lactone lactonase YvrE
MLAGARSERLFASQGGEGERADMRNANPARVIAALTVLMALLVLAAPSSAAAFGFLTKWGSTGTNDGQFGGSQGAEGIVTDASGNVFVVDRGNDRVQKFTSTGGFLTKWGTFGSAAGQFNGPFGIARDAAGNLYVVDSFNFRVEKFNSAGAFVLAWGWGVTDSAPHFEICTSSCHAGLDGTGDGQFHSPTGIAVGAAGAVYVIGDGDERVQKFDSNGNFAGKWGTQGTGDLQFDHPVGIATDAAGNVYVADTDNERVMKFDPTFPTPSLLTKWGSQGSGDGQFAAGGPEGIAVDSAGNVWVTDVNADRVQEFTSTGTFLAKFGSSGTGDGQFTSPQGITVDAAGNVYVTDSNSTNSRVQKFGEPQSSTPPPTGSPPAGGGGPGTSSPGAKKCKKKKKHHRSASAAKKCKKKKKKHR